MYLHEYRFYIFYAVIYSEIPSSACYGYDLKKIAESDTSLNDVKEICSKDFSCYEFFGIFDKSWGTLGWYKCGPDSTRGGDPGNTLYVKSTMKHSDYF